MTKEITLEKGIIEKCKRSINWIIYYDSNKRRAWCNVYASGSEWSEYNTKTIYAALEGTGQRSIFGWRGLTRKQILGAIKESEYQQNAIDRCAN